MVTQCSLIRKHPVQAVRIQGGIGRKHKQSLSKNKTCHQSHCSANNLFNSSIAVLEELERNADRATAQLPTGLRRMISSVVIQKSQACHLKSENQIRTPCCVGILARPTNDVLLTPH